MQTEGQGDCLVVGLGKSGVAAARLMAASGYRVTAVDSGSGSGDTAALAAAGVRVCRHTSQIPDACFELGVLSPGIAWQSPLAQDARQRCGELIAELELGARSCQCPLVAVTGTNGKSTLTKLIHTIVSASGLRSMPAGNYGVPLCELVKASKKLDWLVVEVSSFQLEAVSRFHPRAAVLLNLQPDHLDRHGSMQTYLSLKSRVFARMEAGDCAVVAQQLLGSVRGLVSSGTDTGIHWLGVGDAATSDWGYNAARQEIIGVLQGGAITIPVRHAYFQDAVLGQTAAAAACVACTACGVSPCDVARGIEAFVPLPHRTQFVRLLDGVRYVDDSKATNMAAMCAGIGMVSGPVHLIAGGRLKEKNLDFTKEVLYRRVSCVYLIGESVETLKAAWRAQVPVEVCGNLAQALVRARCKARPGATVLLSPGCASFDQFRSYEDRGMHFQQIVDGMQEG